LGHGAADPVIGVDFLWPLLLAAPLAALSVAWGFRAAAGMEPARRALTITLRTLALALLAAAAAVPHARVAGPDAIETVFLVDVSESVTDPMVQQAVDFIEAHDGRAAVVAFAGRPALVSPMGPPPHRLDRAKLLHRRALKEARAALADDPEAEERVHSIEAWRATVDAWATDPVRALEAAQILFERSNDRRRVLFTDGRALELPPPDRFRGVRTIRLRDPSPDLVVHSLEAPLSIRPGEPFDAKLDLTSRGLGSARLQIAFDGAFQPEMDRDAALVEGRQIVLLRNLRAPPGLAGGLHSIGVLARAEGDIEPRNNSADTFLRLLGRPRFLLLREPGARDEALATLLSSLGAEVTVDRAAALAGMSAELASFDAVVAVGPPAPDVPAEAWRHLSRYVSEMGGGLLFTADPGMAAEPPPPELAALLPIEFKPESPAAGPQPATARKPVTQEVRAPVVAMILVIDKSGSMAGMNLALAKEACIASAKTLSPRDIVGVVAFDRQAYWVLPPTQADRIATIESQILRLHASGWTNIHAGLEAARAGFRGIQAGIKHLILLSDGETTPADFDPLVRGMVEEGITLTTVTLLDGDFDLALMGWLAQAGKGRALWAKDPKALPQIFTHEVRHILRTLERPEAAPPTFPEPSPKTPSSKGLGRKEIKLQAGAPHEATRGIPLEEAPALAGMIAGEARPTAIVPLVEPVQGRPLLAVWRVGLGKVGAWSADFGGEWSNDFVSWPGSGKLMTQILRHLASSLRESPLAADARIQVDGQRATILVDLPAGAPLTGRLSHPISAPLEFVRDETGLWRAEFRLAQVGQVYQATLTSGEETALLAAAAAYSEELALPEPLPRAFDEAAHAGGWVTEIGDAEPPWPAPPPRRQRLDLGPWAALAALLLLAMDLAVRRLSDS
jgi:Ca-activated chloride channel family protein